MILIVLAFLSQLYLHEIDAKASVVGCVTNKQAETIFEEISRMFDNVALHDTIYGLFKNNISENSIAAIKKCDRGFEDKYNEKHQSIVSFAIQAEEDVKEANDNRIKQVEVGRVFEDTWKKMQKLFRLHEKTLYAFDIYLKDSLMQKSARIGQDIRSGNNGDIKWNGNLMKEHLWDETLVAQVMIFRMPEGMFKVMKSVLRQILFTNIASQFYAAVNNTDWEATYRLYHQQFSRISRRYSELTLSKDLRRSSKLKYDTMVVGVEEAEEYATKTNSTLESVREGNTPN
ncbi:hypothetical protein AC249_AIPGENE10197 [Exaiptasia diaphana]|nr:hypothetical protein AC249_AIPGENE10197 [Exaiptasia diaphana]